jgi:cytochrome c biogenesis protein CcdA
MPERLGSIAAGAADQTGGGFGVFVLWAMALAVPVILVGAPSALFGKDADSRTSGRWLVGVGSLVLIGGWLILQMAGR